MLPTPFRPITRRLAGLLAIAGLATAFATRATGAEGKVSMTPKAGLPLRNFSLRVLLRITWNVERGRVEG